VRGSNLNHSNVKSYPKRVLIKSLQAGGHSLAETVSCTVDIRRKLEFYVDRREEEASFIKKGKGGEMACHEKRRTIADRAVGRQNASKEKLRAKNISAVQFNGGKMT